MNIGVEKTYQCIAESYYSITQANVAWVVQKCYICQFRATSKNSGIVIPIRSKRCLNRVQFDLMDFTTTPDRIYNWILQIKDHFSKFIFLIPLIDKRAATVAEAMEIWIGQNGHPRRLYTSLLIS